jgi:hypothetical protein
MPATFRNDPQEVSFRLGLKNDLRLGGQGEPNAGRKLPQPICRIGVVNSGPWRRQYVSETGSKAEGFKAEGPGPIAQACQAR